MKKSAAIFLLFAMLLLSACGGGTDSNASKTQIDVKGVFLLEPSDQLNLSAEGLDTVQRYLFAVYDVDNSENDSNVDLSGFSDAVEVTLNDTNTYEQQYADTQFYRQQRLYHAGRMRYALGRQRTGPHDFCICGQSE